jgi:hypothetical protein
VVDPQRDIIYDRQRSKSPGQATQFNGRQSHHSLFALARILPRSSPRRPRKPDGGAKPLSSRIKSEGMLLRKTRAPLVGLLFIARSI